MYQRVLNFLTSFWQFLMSQMMTTKKQRKMRKDGVWWGVWWAEYRIWLLVALLSLTLLVPLGPLPEQMPFVLLIAVSRLFFLPFSKLSVLYLTSDYTMHYYSLLQISAPGSLPLQQYFCHNSCDFSTHIDDPLNIWSLSSCPPLLQ